MWLNIIEANHGMRKEEDEGACTWKWSSGGAAITGGVGVGLFDSFDVIDKFNKVESETLPIAANHAEYQKRIALFDECYERMEPLFGRL